MSAVPLWLRDPDRWSERVSALGPAVRREAPPARGKKERERRARSSLGERRLRPAARLVAAPEHERTSVYRETHTVLCLTEDYVGRVELTGLLYIIYILRVQYVCQRDKDMEDRQDDVCLHPGLRCRRDHVLNERWRHISLLQFSGAPGILSLLFNHFRVELDYCSIDLFVLYPFFLFYLSVLLLSLPVLLFLTPHLPPLRCTSITASFRPPPHPP